MSVRVKIARTPDDIDRAFRLRHDVYVQEGGYMNPRALGRIYDRFDKLPGTTIMVGEVDGEIVGTVRFGADLGSGTHADDYFDFRPFLPPTARVGSGSMLAVRGDWQGTPRLTSSLVGMCIYHATRCSLTHLLGTVNPEVLDGFLALGFRTLVDGVLHSADGLPFVPVILDLESLSGRIGNFVDCHDNWSILPRCERLFLSPGEKLPTPSDGESYIVIRGDVEVFSINGIHDGFHDGQQVDLSPYAPESCATAVATSKVDLLVVPAQFNAASITAVARRARRPRSGPQLRAVA